MKSEEFKNILKPLIEKTVREVLLQEGVLSRVVSEVAKGLSNTTLTENMSLPTRRDSASEEDRSEKEKTYESQRQERIDRLNQSTNFSSKIFEGVKAIPESSTTSGPLSGIGSADPGVDISDIQKIANGKWKRLIGGKNV